MSRASRRRRLISGLALWCLAATVPAGAASRVDPALRFRTLPTPHFVIYFHRGEERLAARLASIAEDAWLRVGQALGVTAPRRTHVILADQSELANGWATPLPYNTIFVTAAAPAGSEFIGHTDDWLRVVFVHEFTHIVHLDRSEGWARVFRGVFGRIPLALPNLWLPTWQVEGLATWQESALTGGGRRYAGDFRAVEREAGREHRLEPLDRVNGGLTDWPGGLAPYAYGLGFHEFLATHFGAARFGMLADATARTLPFFGSTAFDRIYGSTLGTLWRQYATETETSQDDRPAATPAGARRLTSHGYMVVGPRFATGLCTGCRDEIVYSVRNPDGFPSLHAVSSGGGPSRRLAERYLGSTVGIHGRSLFFDQQDVRRNVGVYSDLYVFDRVTGRVRALTRDQRLQDPDVSPDGRSLVAVRQSGGQRDLVRVDVSADSSGTTEPRITGVGAVEILASEPDTAFNAPRWSPDGRSVAVARHRLGGESEVVTVDAATGAIDVVASSPSARIVTPTWRPDGRAIVAAADFGGDTFNLYEFSAGDRSLPPLQLTATTGGASWPDVSPDGRSIAFVGYTVDGFDLFTIPYPIGGRPTVPGAATAAPSAQLPTGDPEMESQAYSPWRTLPPTSWFPVVENDQQLRAGISTGGFDVLGRHAYSASATWLVRAPDDAMAPGRAEPDWETTYAYDRWRPTLFVSASSDTLFSALPGETNNEPTTATLRERQIEAGVLFPIRHVRSVQQALVSFTRTRDSYFFPEAKPPTDRSAVRLGLSTSTARVFGYSISPESGISLGGTAEIASRALGSDESGTTLTFDGRAYAPGLGPHHVIAIRAGGGWTTGHPGFGRIFLLGGAAASGDVLDFGRDAFSLMRGFSANSYAGTRVALLNVDYRWPIARPQRGFGTWPLFLHTLHAAIFTDAGETWTDDFDPDDLKVSAGAELSMDTVIGFYFPFRMAFGAAWGHTRRDHSGRGTIYVRIGRAF